MAFECSLHGLVRGENMELGRDSDTGGQVGFSPCLGSSLIFFKKLPGHGCGFGSFEGSSESKDSPLPFISKPSKELATFTEELTVLSRFFGISIFLRTTIIY
jgi:hypothetical protein